MHIYIYIPFDNILRTVAQKTRWAWIRNFSILYSQLLCVWETSFVWILATLFEKLNNFPEKNKNFS